jgi:hypothetical protein
LNLGFGSILTEVVVVVVVVVVLSPGYHQDGLLNFSVTASFHFLSNSLFTVIMPFSSLSGLLTVSLNEL